MTGKVKGKFSHFIQNPCTFIRTFPCIDTLVAARLRHIGGTRWGKRRYLNMDLLKEMETEEVAA